MSLDATALRDSILAGERTVRDAVLECFDNLDSKRDLNAFLQDFREDALVRAEELDAAKARGDATGELFGVPIAIKANMCLRGQVSSCGSRMLETYKPPYTATFVQRLLDAGAVIVGATNMDEFAMGSSGENSAFGPTLNPWDVERTPGGSSSGSAVAVAAGIVPIALGSDTGGSVRQPAAMCGIHGFKPTYGRVSRYGLIAFGSSLDQVSPFARTVRDLELVLQVISGEDEFDSSCLPRPPFDPATSDSGRLDGLKFGVPKEYFPADLDSEIRARCEAAIDQLVALGAERVEIELPNTRHAIPTYYVVATAEASSNLARYEGVGYGTRTDGDGTLQGMFAATRATSFGDEVTRRILLGTYVLSAGYAEKWYGKALRLRRLLKNDFDRAFEEVDFIVSPTSPIPAFRLGEKTEDPIAMYLADSLTTPMSLVGLPAISTPCGFIEHEGKSLPVGLQIVAPLLSDARALYVARVFEEATEHSKATPPASAEGAKS